MKSRSGNTTTLSGNVGTAALAIPTPRTPAQPMASAPVNTVAAVRFTRLTRLALWGRAGRRWAPGVLDELVLTVPPRKARRDRRPDLLLRQESAHQPGWARTESADI